MIFIFSFAALAAILFCIFMVFRIDESDGFDNTNFLIDELNEMQKEIEDDREESFLQELIDHLVSSGAEEGFRYMNPVNKRLYNIKMDYAFEHRIRCNSKKRNLELLIEAKEAKDLYEREGKVKFVSQEEIKRDLDWMIYKRINNLDGFKNGETDNARAIWLD